MVVQFGTVEWEQTPRPQSQGLLDSTCLGLTPWIQPTAPGLFFRALSSLTQQDSQEIGM